MANAEDLQRAVHDVVADGVERGLLHDVAEDERLDGRRVTIRGRRLVNFGSCSYLGLELHPRMRAGVIDAVERYGTQFSSSRAYLSAPAYRYVEKDLAGLFDRPTLVTSSTTMGHIAALPVLVAPTDTLFLDHQVHHSVQTAATLVRAQGSTVQLLPHNDMRLLAKRIEQAAGHGGKVWYAADGLYSMYADFVPVDALDELVARFDNLWLYVDDAHSFSWTGRHGRGYALQRLAPRTLERTVVAGSLNKSFAAAGGAITFPTAELFTRVLGVGGPMIFSGPVQPPMLGAILATAALHRTDEVVERQDYLLGLIRRFNTEAAEAGLPLVSASEAPIRFIGAGTPEVAYNLVGRLRAQGFFTDIATFPAVAAKRSGARITLTAHHRPADITAIVQALAEALPEALAQERVVPQTVERVFAKQLAGRPVRLLPTPRRDDNHDHDHDHPNHLWLDRQDSIRDVPRDEWDAMFAERGSFDWEGLRTLEEAFAGTRGPDDPAADPADDPADAPEDRWKFTYLLVRGGGPGGPVLAATFLTTALWKDDMLSAVDLSEHVEHLRRAKDDPYYLTSTTVAMGSLITEGNHLWLDRDAAWRDALRLLLAAARAEEDATGAGAVVVRDMPAGDEELHQLLLGEGFVRIPLYDTWIRDLDFTDDEHFLAGLGRKARYHQRTNVLAWEDAYDVQILQDPSPAELDHLHALYRNVHARNVALNVFPLPRRLLDAVAASPAWELLTLTLRDAGPARPVAFACHHLGAGHVQPVFVGLDYDYVASHHSYQQLLWQAIRSGQRNSASRILLGMSADLQKARFGAHPVPHWAYVQATQTYNADVLTQLQQTI
jgi:7-keto-8-aminopelargonate synthetase-like enzyme